MGRVLVRKHNELFVVKDKEILLKIRGILARFGSMIDAEDKMPYLDLTAEMEKSRAEVKRYVAQLSAAMHEQNPKLVVELHKGEFHFTREQLKNDIDRLLKKM